MEFTRTLKGVHRADKDLVGERAVDLAVLQEKDFVVPLTFVITNQAFEAFINENKLQGRVAIALQGADQNRVYERIRELLLNGDFPDEMVKEIVEGYESLGVEHGDTLNDIVKADDAPFVTVMLSPNHTLPSEKASSSTCAASKNSSSRSANAGPACSRRACSATAKKQGSATATSTWA